MCHHGFYMKSNQYVIDDLSGDTKLCGDMSPEIRSLGVSESRIKWKLPFVGLDGLAESWMIVTDKISAYFEDRRVLDLGCKTSISYLCPVAVIYREQLRGFLLTTVAERRELDQEFLPNIALALETVAREGDIHEGNFREVLSRIDRIYRDISLEFDDVDISILRRK